tara:strand:- start:70 stop:426 length:357 start_codon:yes stop_codon:yes gene_type:complete
MSLPIYEELLEYLKNEDLPMLPFIMFCVSTVALHIHVVILLLCYKLKRPYLGYPFEFICRVLLLLTVSLNGYDDIVIEDNGKDIVFMYRSNVIPVSKLFVISKDRVELWDSMRGDKIK